MAVHRNLLRGCVPLALLAVALMGALSAAPAGATPGPTVTYNSSESFDCVLDPSETIGLNIEGPIPTNISLTGPAFVEPNDSYSFTNSTAALVIPGAWATAFASVGANYAAGVVTGFPLDVTGTSPAVIDPPQTAPFSTLNVMNLGPGLPLGPVAIAANTPVSLSAPVTTSPVAVTGTTVVYDRPTGTVQGFTIGPLSVTGAAGGTSTTSIDTAPGWTGNSNLGFPATGGGIVALAGGYLDSTLNLNTSGERKAGPLPAVCNAPTNTLASVPIVAPPAVTASPASQTVTGGATATFTAAATGSPAPTVQWQDSTDGGTTWAADTTDAGNQTNTLSVVTTATTPSGTEYRAVYTNAVADPQTKPPGPYTVGTATSSPATLSVSAPVCALAPSIATQPVSVSVVAPAAASFSVVEGAVPANCSAASHPVEGLH